MIDIFWGKPKGTREKGEVRGRVAGQADAKYGVVYEFLLGDGGGHKTVVKHT